MSSKSSFRPSRASRYAQAALWMKTLEWKYRERQTPFRYPAAPDRARDAAEKLVPGLLRAAARKVWRLIDRYNRRRRLEQSAVVLAKQIHTRDRKRELPRSHPDWLPPDVGPRHAARLARRCA